MGERAGERERERRAPLERPETRASVNDRGWPLPWVCLCLGFCLARRKRREERKREIREPTFLFCVLF